jgi:CRISPR-associated endonuclease Csn1
MVRVDVFTKNSKYYLVPYYVGDLAKNKAKNKAIIGAKPELLWETVDSSFDYVFSLFKNDLVNVIDSKGKELFGYYCGCDRFTNSIEILHQAGECSWRGIGIRTLKKFEKYSVDILGNYHKVKKEKPPYELA